MASRTIRIGVSSCLLGQPVRYDGGHRNVPFISDTLARQFELLPVCPEVELGLGTPREMIELVQLGEQIRLKSTQAKVDLTEEMYLYASHRIRELQKEGIGGFIAKSRSPSCGPARVKLRQPSGDYRRVGVGKFIEVLTLQMPGLPIIDDEQLQSEAERDNWIERVLAYQAKQSP